ncbi:MAG TPA: hypothetical protein VE155_01020 [Pseudonocardiaceae bacterium]|nr:hypothetical protein [Pseudonocardiaceae bacterium]
MIEYQHDRPRRCGGVGDGVTLGACGIALLVEIAEQARAAGMALQLVAQSRLALRAPEVTMADQLVSRSSTVAEALARCLT